MAWACQLRNSGRKGRFRQVEQYVVLLLLLMLCWESRKLRTRATEVDDFLDALARQVKMIANKSVQNAAQACGEQTACVAFNNSFCGQGCNNILVVRNQSYVRTPNPDQSTADDVQTSVCVQRMLDVTFRDVAEEPRPTAFVQYYFGSSDGTFRYYPGRKLFNRSVDYDPRERPWCRGAIAVSKDLVILIDNGYHMLNPPYSVTSKSAFNYAVEVAQHLLSTGVTNTDRLTIMTFNSSNTTVLAQVEVTTTDFSSRIGSLAMALNNAIEPVSANKGSSDLTAGLEKALSIFNATQETDKLKIVVLLTDGSATPEQAEMGPLLAKVQEQNTTLFTYNIGGSTALSDFTCSSQLQHAYFEALVLLSLSSPLRGLKSFFSFLARCRQKVNNGQVFWQKVYTSASGLGQVITAAYPALDSSGQLVGVAGIDVQINGLNQQLYSDIGTSLDDESRQVTLASPDGADLNCKNSGPSHLSCAPPPDKSAICARNDDSDHLDQICCKNCGVSGPGPSSDTWKIITGVVAGVVGLIVLVIVGVFGWPRLNAWCNGVQIEPPPFPPPGPYNPPSPTPVFL